MQREEQVVCCHISGTNVGVHEACDCVERVEEEALGVERGELDRETLSTTAVTFESPYLFLR